LGWKITPNYSYRDSRNNPKRALLGEYFKTPPPKKTPHSNKKTVIKILPKT
jgi:hypothetical protein